MKNTNLPPELQAAREEIEGYALEYGLDFFPILYEVLDYRTLYETAALGGFPTRYPHWRFGMDYDQLLKGHVWLGSTIYEMVINTNPSYSYLLEGNEAVTQKMVMAHVTGHVDFFKNNMWFAHTNRKMLDEMANHASRIQRMIDRYGHDLVEDFIDTCLSLENLIDYHAPYIRRPEAQSHQPIVSEDNVPVVEGLKVDRGYMQDYINPPEFLEDQRQKLETELQKQKRFPENPQKDILLFLLNYAPLERWQHTVLEIVRDEAYYFAPQGMTKILNEGWACLVAGSLLFTEKGIMPLEQVVAAQETLLVSDGQTRQRVYDWARFANRETIRIRTRHGLELEGSVTHRLMLPDGSWRRLDELALGDQVVVSGGQQLWSQQYIAIDWQPAQQTMLPSVANQVEPESYPQAIGARSAAYATATATLEYTETHCQTIAIPAMVDEHLAAFLGYLIGSGALSEIDPVVDVTTLDANQADHVAGLIQSLFGLTAHQHQEMECWHVCVYSDQLTDFLTHLGLKTGSVARLQHIPDVILRSPASVVAAFLRALYDCTGDAGESGIILSTTSSTISHVVQLLLLNFGILATRCIDQNECWLVQTTGTSATRFWQHIGFSLPKKTSRLRAYIEHGQGCEPAAWSDTVVALEHRRADVYDISVTETHRYAAQGFINHNSYWHSTIMTQRALQASEIISFADLHSGVVATSSGRLNPYKLGLELLRDIEDRWNTGKFGKEYEECDDIAAKRNWDKQLGLGRQKIFDVRRLYNDVTFIDEFLTPEFVMEHKLFTFRYNRDTDFYEIASREFQEVKEKLLFRLTNFGQPFIYIEDANYNNRSELYLRHRHEGVDLKMDYARDTMRNLNKIWTRPIHLETILDEKKRLLSFDGRDFSERRID